ncbi:DnaC DNA replication protein [uncultured Caudovirales phage]|uniref:DnaC DNA replication protein n=1 Tax=uncultured Caudovirales phage TaxID=2100421 RepID=A0A6J5LKF3_9CAUD|nr:DnaC DNA replication protein [uncultured Caudovirales phage]
MTAETICSWMKKPEKILLYHGSSGCGKTFFCAALTSWCFDNFKSFRYHRDEDVLRRLRLGISEGSGDYLLHLQYLIDDDFIILDDVGSGINPEKFTNRDLEFRREVFFSFLDYRYNRQLPTVITSNFTKNDFKEIYSERIISRLFAKENTIISAFDGPDKRQLGM